MARYFIGTWQEPDFTDAIQSLPELDNAISFLTRNNFIAGPNNPHGSIAIWVS